MRAIIYNEDYTTNSHPKLQKIRQYFYSSEFKELSFTPIFKLLE